MLPNADVLYRASDIRTMNPAQPHATGLVVRNRRVLATGAFDWLAANVAEGTELVDLRPMTILPGFIDAHAHVAATAYLQDGVDCSPAAVNSIVEIQEALSGSSVRSDGWVTGSGYVDHALAEGRHPTRAELDVAVPTNPCVLYHASLHACVVNSTGLRRLGLAEEAPDPDGGRLGRESDGRLNGLLFESPMADLFARNMAAQLSALDGGARGSLMAAATVALARLGITTSTEAAADASAIRLLRDAHRSGQLKIRVAAMPLEPEARALGRAGIATGFGDERLWMGPAKLFADGGMSSRTAAMDQPYLSPKGERGMLLQTPDGLATTVADLSGMGFAVAVHAQGERAIRYTLEAFEQPAAAGLRHRIEHGGAFEADLRARAASLGTVVASQPGFISQLGDGFLDALGDERAAYLYPFRSLRDIGVRVAGSSDAPVIDASPLLAIRDAIRRQTSTGRAFSESESLAPEDAVQMHTVDGAFSLQREHDLGSLAPDKLADFVVLAADPVSVAAQDIPDIHVALTIVGGSVVHVSDAAARATASLVSSSSYG